MRRRPLRTPYVLSFGTLEAFAARLVVIEVEDGRRGVGEVVALPGYGDETDEDVARSHAAAVPELAGCTLSEARVAFADAAGATPFAASAVLAAIDVASGDAVLPRSIDSPLVAAIATDAPDRMLAAIAERMAAGYRTIKVKFGRDAAADAAVVRPLLDGLPAGVSLRFDANQAYDEGEAAAVLAAFDHPRRDRVELFEQPLGLAESDWEAFARIAPASPVPLMLDESIHGPADIDRAAEVGAAWVKLKACKGAGVTELVAQARQAKALGLRVILGNGVATDVANLFEAAVRARHPELFDGAGEENGFARLRAPVLAAGPRLQAGSMRWEAPAGDVDPWALAADVGVSPN